MKHKEKSTIITNIPELMFSYKSESNCLLFFLKTVLLFFTASGRVVSLTYQRVPKRLCKLLTFHFDSYFQWMCTLFCWLLTLSPESPQDDEESGTGKCCTHRGSMAQLKNPELRIYSPCPPGFSRINRYLRKMTCGFRSTRTIRWNKRHANWKRRSEIVSIDDMTLYLQNANYFTRTLELNKWI